ncbi:MAG: hypothetical protein M5U18_06005 [Dehalococcoidia bacterium]|nr:hypothetical protein [Dehalococcoidia bacterium]
MEHPDHHLSPQRRPQPLPSRQRALWGPRGTGRSRTPVHPAFALTEGVLALYPGYARDPAEDARAARQRWEAAAGPSLGTITIDFPSVFDPLYSASSVVTGILNEVLGDQFRPAVETYTTISRRVLDGYYGNGRAAFWFGWGPPFLPRPPPRLH